jgi:predicted GNAT superfamily acetyltransferase
MRVRPVTELQELQKCLELQREAFGWADIDLLPRRFLVVLGHIGGLVLGAYDTDRLVAFLNAVPGIRGRMPYWHSHMLAVSKDYWNSGVGTQLKLAQRDEGLKRGLRLIEWTFDPLESKNAYLNIAKLGVIVRRFYPNHYGETTGVRQHGMDSDRVIAEWWIDDGELVSDHPGRSLQSRPPLLYQEGSDVRRVAIPADIQSFKKQSLESAREIQKRVREQFLQNIADDYFVADFKRGDEWSEYIFIPGASRVHKTD